jgi:uncharacterized protein (TIGR03382 family)
MTAVVLGMATGQDDVDGAIAPTADRTGPFPVGVTTVTWRATDRSGQTGTATQRVTITDTTPPRLTLVGAAMIEVQRGGTYTLEGATAVDLVDGDRTAAIRVSGTFDVSDTGTYPITYEVADTRGNEAAPVVRTIEVVGGDDGGCQTGGGEEPWLAVLALSLLLRRRRR